MPESTDELSALMLEYALGTADSAEMQQVNARLAKGDPLALAALAEAQAVVGMIGLSVDPIMPPVHVRHQVLSQIAADISAEQSASRLSVHSAGRSSVLRMPRMTQWFAWGTTAVAACLAIVLVVQVQKNRSMSQQLAVASVADTGLLNVTASPYVQFAKLASYTGETPNTGEACAAGRVLFCPVSKQYQLMVFRMPQQEPGRVYQMWLMTDDRQTVIPAGTFNVDARGSAMHYIKPATTTAWSVAAITDEPAGGSLKPTGNIHLVGSLATPPELQVRLEKY
jgi:hypothetical protein